MNEDNDKFSIEEIAAVKRLLCEEFEAQESDEYLFEHKEAEFEDFCEDEDIASEELSSEQGEEAELLEAPAKRKKLEQELKEWIKDIAIAVIAAVIILQIIKPTIVVESSMENTLHSGDYVILSRQSYTLFGDPERGDIIVFKSGLKDDKGGDKLLVKRVIAVPGDRISISGGSVYIDGVAQDEPYIKDGYTTSEMEELCVPEGKLFCMGDNRQNSIDSRSDRIGLVDEKDVLGRVVIRLLPIKEIKVF